MNLTVRCPRCFGYGYTTVHLHGVQELFHRFMRWLTHDYKRWDVLAYNLCRYCGGHGRLPNMTDFPESNFQAKEQEEA